MTSNVETKAKVIALVRGGETATKAAEIVSRELGVVIPERTAQYWAMQLRNFADEEKDRTLLDLTYAVAVRASHLQLESLDELVESGEPLYKHGSMLNFYAGTASDKLQRRQELADRARHNQPPQIHGQYVIVVPGLPEPPSIEAEYREVEE